MRATAHLERRQDRCHGLGGRTARFYLRTRASSYKRYPIKGLDIAVLIVSIALIAIGFLF